MNSTDTRQFDWTLVRSLLAVADQKSYSAAARHLGISQPTVGRHVQELEAQLGLVLLQRSSDGFDLSSAGRSLLEPARDMRAAAAKLSLVAEGRSEALTGTVRLTASEMVATYYLPEILSTLWRTHPEIDIELTATNSTENLLLREADIAVRMVEPSQADVIARKLGVLELGVFASKDYVATLGMPQTIEDLWDHCFIGYDRSDLMINGMRELGIAAKREDFAFRTDNHVVYLEAIASGVGVGSTLKTLCRQRGMIELLPEMKIADLPVWLVAHQELKTSARVRAVYDYVGEALVKRLRSDLTS